MTWTQATTCSAATAEQPSSSTKTELYVINTTSTLVEFPVYGLIGLWYMCILPLSGTWTKFAIELEIIRLPVFTPTQALAGNPTPIRVQNTGSTVEDGDLIVLQPDNCNNAHLTITSGNSLTKTALEGLQVYTDVRMEEVGTLKVCFATQQTGGDSSDDFMMLDDDLLQLGPPDVGPTRVVRNSRQEMTLYGGIWGAKVAFVAKHNGTTSCGGDDEVAARQGADDGTFIIILAGRSSQKIDMGFTPTSLLGSWGMCYKASSASVWIPLHGKEIVLFEAPFSTPAIGIAGSNNTISFVGSHTNG